MAYKIEDLCRRRKIKSLDISTPLLIPSFSSRGFPYLLEIWNQIKEYLPNITLISCYDIYYDLIKFEEVADVILLDSGGYEAHTTLDSFYDEPTVDSSKEWSRDKYIETLSKINQLSTCIVVSYDSPNIPISDQIAQAKRSFADINSPPSDFLLKPSKGDLIDLEELSNSIELLDGFDILGITENELGYSVVERLRNMARLRTMLTEKGLEIPIHLFGCLDPISVWLYYFCGADIFDGLSWLRYAFLDDKALYKNSWAILTNRVDIPDNDLIYESYLNNLDVLKDIQRRMAQFQSLDDLSITHLDIKGILHTLSLADISFNGRE